MKLFDKFLDWLAAKLASRVMAKVRTQQLQSGAEFRRAEWITLPGNRLAYGDTGFEIELLDKPNRNGQYRVHDPNGSVEDYNVLAFAKMQVQDEQRDRDLFSMKVFDKSQEK